MSLSSRQPMSICGDDVSPESPSHLTPLQQECVNLLKARQYRSCMLIAQLELAQASNKADTVIPLELMGDCAQATGQHRRAISYYREASLRASTNSKLRWKEAESLSAVGYVMEATTVLQRVPTEQRTLGIHMAMGHLHVATGRHEEAIRSFMEALKLDPYAIEAVEWLAVLQASEAQVTAVVETSLAGKRTESLLPVLKLVSAHFLIQHNQPSAALNAFLALEQKFPDNVYLLQKVATLQMQLRHEADAERNFARIRHLDENCIEAMDQYALLFRDRGALSELNRLAHEMLEADDKRPEPWTVLSMYHSATKDYEKALAYVDKAIVLDQQHACAHRLKGEILLAQNQPEKAAAPFFHAKEISRDVASYEGMVECFLARGQFTEAIMTAREALEIAPRDPRALTLVGLTFAKAPQKEGKDRAKRAFRKALNMGPGTLRPLLALVDLYIQEREYDVCVEILRKGIEGSPEVQSVHNNEQGVLQATLGEVLTLRGGWVDGGGRAEDYMEAMTCFHTAMSLNPQNAEAQRGLDRLEKLMRGMDPSEDGDDSQMQSQNSTDYSGNYDRAY